MILQKTSFPNIMGFEIKATTTSLKIVIGVCYYQIFVCSFLCPYYLIKTPFVLIPKGVFLCLKKQEDLFCQS